MTSHGSCAHCCRRYRSAKSRDLCEARAAVIRELTDGTPALHLRALVTYSGAEPTKHQRHKTDSQSHRMGQQ